MQMVTPAFNAILVLIYKIKPSYADLKIISSYIDKTR
jgi:hypothetical protein